MPLALQRHEAVVVHLTAPLPYVVPSVMDYTPHSGETGLYFRHERAGQLIAGLHTEEANEEIADPDDYARSAGPDFLEEVAEKITSRLPGLQESSLAHGWAGLYLISPDGVPQVGPAPGRDSVIVAGGAGGSGIQLSLGAGRARRRLGAARRAAGDQRGPAAGAEKGRAERRLTSPHAVRGLLRQLRVARRSARCCAIRAARRSRGVDGFFLYDHIVPARDRVMPSIDPWTVLAAVAAGTERVVLGPMVTPVARRRPWELAHQVAALDLLSGGRVVLGVGLGEREDFGGRWRHRDRPRTW